MKLPVVHAHNMVPDSAISGRVTSGDVTSGHVTSGCSPLFPHTYDFVRTHILLMYLHLNNWEFCRVKSENMTVHVVFNILRKCTVFIFHLMKTKKMLHKCQ